VGSPPGDGFLLALQDLGQDSAEGLDGRRCSLAYSVTPGRICSSAIPVFFLDVPAISFLQGVAL